MTIQIIPFDIEAYDDVLALWEQCEGIGLSDADSWDSIQTYLTRNPDMSFVARSGDWDKVVGFSEGETDRTPMDKNSLRGRPLYQPAVRIDFDETIAVQGRGWTHDISTTKNAIISGEVSSFVSDCKGRLAKHGVKVKWNAEKKLYEVEKTQQILGDRLKPHSQGNRWGEK